MSNQCQIDPWGGEGEADSRVGSRGSVPNRPLTILGPKRGKPPWYRSEKILAPIKIKSALPPPPQNTPPPPKTRNFMGMAVFLQKERNFSRRPQSFRAACLQNKTAPEKILNRYEKRFEKCEKKIQKTIRNVFEIFLAPLRPLKNISPALFQHVLKVFHRPKFAQKKSLFFFFYHREALQG